MSTQKMVALQSTKSILIYGYGLSGKSSEACIKKNTIKADITIFDENIEAFSTPPDFENTDLIILSPGISRDKIPAQFHTKIKTNTQIFFDLLSETQKRKIIGITGTKGKSSTTKFAHEVLQAAGYKSTIAGNYGIPLLDIYPDLKKYDFIVAELSSYQLEHLTVSPHYALCTNLFVDHLDRHKTKASYHAAKANLWMHQTENDNVFFPSVHTQSFTHYMPDSSVHWCAPFVPTSDQNNTYNPMMAKHMLQNFGLVQTLAEELDIADTVLQTVFETFKGLPHRLQKVGEVNGRIFVDDSISTTPKSALAAAQFYAKNLAVLLLGGQDRSQDFEALFQDLKTVAPQTHIGILPSETSPALQIALATTHWPQSQIFVASSLKEAVQTAYKKMKEGTVCVLSPSAPSYDRYKNYKERGKKFQKAIQSLP